jgi:hypothetical protein
MKRLKRHGQLIEWRAKVFYSWAQGSFFVRETLINRNPYHYQHVVRVVHPVIDRSLLGSKHALIASCERQGIGPLWSPRPIH